MTEKEFSLRLAQLRSEKGVSARDMSLSIGQNASYINNIENGKALPSMTGFFYICEYLNITPGEFFDAENKNPEKIQEVVENLKKLDSEQLDNISAIILYAGLRSCRYPDLRPAICLKARAVRFGAPCGVLLLSVPICCCVRLRFLP